MEEENKMIQKNPLLFLRKKIHQNDQSVILQRSKYNFELGLWEQKSSFTIAHLWNSDPKYGTTLITKTREGTDQSEGSH